MNEEAAAAIRPLQQGMGRTPRDVTLTSVHVWIAARKVKSLRDSINQCCQCWPLDICVHRAASARAR